MTASTPPAHTPSPSAKPRRWQVEALDWQRIEHARIAHDENLFYLLASASFIESGSDLYTRNLVQHYQGHDDVANWLQHQWEPEELQHGRALALYVQAAWPAFDWQAGFDSFLAEYGPLCNMEALEEDRALEMVARCVVEMGTTTYYQTLRGLSQEPLLTELLGHIRNDEVNHYKHFLAYFRQLSAARPVSRLRIARALYQRLLELRSSDSDVALRHVWAHRGNLFAEGAQSFEAISGRVYKLVSQRLPADQAVRMLLKPLALPHRLERLLDPPAVWATRRVLST